MGAAAHKERLILDVVKLRDAERRSGATTRDDIAAVRADLEAMAGATVSRAMAARTLGVSQTALERWIATGDIGLLVAPNGRWEVSLRSLIELLGAVQERRIESPQDRHPLSSVLRTRREAAEHVRISSLLKGAEPRHPRGSGHRGAELRALAYHRAVAQRLDKETVRDAHERLARWSSQKRIDPRNAQKWETILEEPISQIAKLIGSDNEHMRELRQSSPFAGTLNEPERKRVLAAVEQVAI